VSRKAYSVLFFFLLITGIGVLSFKPQPVNAIGTVYIRADGSIDPPDSPISTLDNVTYTLTGNITAVSDGITVERDNVIVDGNQYTVQGSATYNGIDLAGISNVTVKNTAILNFGYGIYVSHTEGTTIDGNNITNNQYGLYFDSSFDNSIDGNTIANGMLGLYFESSSNNSVGGNNIVANDWSGIDLGSSSNNSISGNNIANDTNGLYFKSSSNNNIDGNNITANDESGLYFDSSSNNDVKGNLFVNDGLYVSNSFGNVVSANFVNGKPLVYLEDTSDVAVGEAGQVVLIQCNRILVENLNLQEATVDVELWQTNDTEISKNNITSYGDGIFLYSSFGDNISGNNITINNHIMNNVTVIGDFGIAAYSCIDNNVNGNTITGGTMAIYLESSSNNIISDNNMIDNRFGIYFDYSSNNSISGNNMANNWAGIDFDSSTDNTASGNTIERAHQYGLYLDLSSENKFYHNNFIGNMYQVRSFSSLPNIWDNGYPSGGNYWDDYTGHDSYSGPYQNETGSDGIGDTPYILDTNNTDNYPLTIHDVAFSDLTTPKTLVGKGYTMWINVTLQNMDYNDETVNVTIFANSTAIFQTQVSLAAKNATAMAFLWNTTDFVYGNYTISAYAEPLLGETNTANNNFTCAVPVHVGVPGDVSSEVVGVYNRQCDMKDIAYLIVHFMGKPGNSKWDPNADINDDNVINMKDVAIAVLNFNHRENFP
jgi:parallel beta-helix repeat protein